MCYMYFYFFCLHCCLINVQIFDYPDYYFTQVPPSPYNQGLTAFINCGHRMLKMNSKQIYVYQMAAWTSSKNIFTE